MKSVARQSAIVLATALLALLLWQFRMALILFIIALFVAAALRPAVRRLARWGVPEAAARLGIHLALVAGILTMLYFLSGPLIREFQALSNDITVWYEVTYVQWQSGEMWQQWVAGYLTPPTVVVEQLMSGENSDLLTLLLSVTQGGLALAAGSAIILAASLYWSQSQNRFERLWMSLLPATQRGRARRAWRRVESTVGDYLRSEGVQLFLAFLLLAVGYRLLSIPYPLTLATLGSVVWLIPVVGPLLIALPVSLAAWQVGSVAAVLAVLFTVGIVLLLELVVEPRFFNRRKYSPFLVVLGIVVTVFVFGPLGLLLGPLLALTVQALTREYVSGQRQREERTAELDKMRSRFEALREQISADTANGETRELANIVERLGHILNSAGGLKRNKSP